MKIKTFYFLANKVLHNRGLLVKLKRKKIIPLDVLIFTSSTSIES